MSLKFTNLRLKTNPLGAMNWYCHTVKCHSIDESSGRVYVVRCLLGICHPSKRYWYEGHNGYNNQKETILIFLSTSMQNNRIDLCITAILELNGFFADDSHDIPLLQYSRQRNSSMHLMMQFKIVSSVFCYGVIVTHIPLFMLCAIRISTQHFLYSIRRHSVLH